MEKLKMNGLQTEQEENREKDKSRDETNDTGK